MVIMAGGTGVPHVPPENFQEAVRDHAPRVSQASTPQQVPQRHAQIAQRESMGHPQVRAGTRIHAYVHVYAASCDMDVPLTFSLVLYERERVVCDSSSAHMCLCACARRYQSEGNSLHTGRRSRREQEGLDERLRICVTNNEI